METQEWREVARFPHNYNFVAKNPYLFTLHDVNNRSSIEKMFIPKSGYDLDFDDTTSEIIIFKVCS